MSLSRPHPLIRTCLTSPWETQKATVQLRLLSGRYRLKRLTKHWQISNKSTNGSCSLPLCVNVSMHEGNIESFLLSCKSLSNAREEALVYIVNYISSHPFLIPTVIECLSSERANLSKDENHVNSIYHYSEAPTLQN